MYLYSPVVVVLTIQTESECHSCDKEQDFLDINNYAPKKLLIVLINE